MPSPCFDAVQAWRKIRMVWILREDGEAVEEAVHGGQPLIPGSALLEENAFETDSKRALTETIRDSRRPSRDHLLQRDERARRRRINIHCRDIVAMRRKINGVESRLVQLRSQFVAKATEIDCESPPIR